MNKQIFECNEAVTVWQCLRIYKSIASQMESAKTDILISQSLIRTCFSSDADRTEFHNNRKERQELSVILFGHYGSALDFYRSVLAVNGLLEIIESLTDYETRKR